MVFRSLSFRIISPFTTFVLKNPKTDHSFLWPSLVVCRTLPILFFFLSLNEPVIKQDGSAAPRPHLHSSQSIISEGLCPSFQTQCQPQCWRHRCKLWSAQWRPCRPSSSRVLCKCSPSRIFNFETFFHYRLEALVRILHLHQPFNAHFFHHHHILCQLSYTPSISSGITALAFFFFISVVIFIVIIEVRATSSALASSLIFCT